MVELQEQTRKERPVSLVDIFLKARELEREGKDVIHFDAGEPDFDPPEQVMSATINAIRAGRGRYTESGGIPEARRAISEHIARKIRVEIATNQIVVTAGGRLALYYAFASLPKNSKIGIISPDWPAYKDLARFIGHQVQFFETRLEDGWDIDVDQIRNSDCNAIVLNYPNNPTGKILEDSVIRDLVQIASEKKMTVVSDEVYSDYVFGKKHFRSILETTGLHYILVTSLSKSYAMTGYRAAYLVSDEKTIQHIGRMNSMIMTSAPEFVQYAIVAALSCEEYVKEKAELIKKRRDVAASALKERLGAELYSPDGALYVFPKLHSGRSFDSERFALELLEKKFVSVSPGTAFGSWYKEHVRMTLLQDEKRIEEGIERMAQLIE